MVQTYAEEQYCGALRTWKNIEIAFHGPYEIPNQKFVNDTESKDGHICIVITILDTFSRWITARSIELKCYLENYDNGMKRDLESTARSASGFVVTTLCNFGLANFNLDFSNLAESVFGSEFPEKVAKYLEYQLEKIDNMTFHLTKENAQCHGSQLLFPVATDPLEKQKNLFHILTALYNKSDSGNNPQVNKWITRVVGDYKELNAKETENIRLDLNTFLDIVLFKERISFSCCDLGSENDQKPTPFSHMFAQRDPFMAFSENHCQENVSTGTIENTAASSSRQYHRRHLKKALLECRHCGDIFSSRISFKFHQKMHLDEAKRRGVLEGEKIIDNDGSGNEDVGDISAMYEGNISGSDTSQSSNVLNDPDYDISEKLVCGLGSHMKIRKLTQQIKPLACDRALNVAKVAAKFENCVIPSNDINDMDPKNENPLPSPANDLNLRETKKGDRKTNLIRLEEIDIRNDTEAVDSNIDVKKTTVQNVKALLTATRGDRRKRGKYIRYDKNIRNEITEFAELHGASKTAKIYTERLNLDISESTVRNFIKSCTKKDRQLDKLKSEIGQYAPQFGMESYLGKDKTLVERIDKSKEEIETSSELPRETVSRFKNAFSSASGQIKDADHVGSVDIITSPKPLEVTDQADAACLETDNASPDMSKHLKSVSQRFVFDDHLKSDIGKYAFLYGNGVAINYFSTKLQTNMKESTVRKFKRLWMKQKRIDNTILSKSKYNEKKRTGVANILPKNQQSTSSGSITFLDTQNKTTISLENKVRSQKEANKERPGLSKRSNTGLTSGSTMATSPSLVYASLHGRTGNTANLSTTEPKKTNQSIQSSCRNNPEYDNMPMSLIIKDKVLKKG